MKYFFLALGLLGIGVSADSPPTACPTGFTGVCSADTNFYVIDVFADLTDADLSGTDLSGAEMIHVNLQGADLTGADLTGVRDLLAVRGELASCPALEKLPVGWVCENKRLIGPEVDVSGLDLSRADLTSAELRNIRGKLANCPASDRLPNDWMCDETLTKNYLIGPAGTIVIRPGATEAYASGLGAYLDGADLSGADLSGANLAGVKGKPASCPDKLPNDWMCNDKTNGYLIGLKTFLVNADLSDADLTGADLTGAKLTGADLSNADLTGATLTEVTGKLASCPFSHELPAGWVCENNYLIGPGADLYGADLSGADLSGADLTGVYADLLSCPDKLPTGWACAGAMRDIQLIGPGQETIWGRTLDLSDHDLSGVDLTGALISGVEDRCVKGKLASCPDKLPNAEWMCDETLTKNYLIGPGVDLTGVDLSGADLTGATLAGVQGQLASCPDKLPAGWVCENNYLIGPGGDVVVKNPSGLDLSGVDLSGADLTGATLARVKGKLASCPDKLPNENWKCDETLTDNRLVGPDAVLTDADLSGADLTGATLTGVRGQLANCPTSNHLPAGWVCKNKFLIGPGAWLLTEDLSGLDLSGLDLTGVLLYGAHLANVDLTGAVLTDADLGDVDLTGATLTGVKGKLASCPDKLPADWKCDATVTDNYLIGPGADLTDADLSGAYVRGADLTDAVLKNADLTSAELTGAVLTNADLIGATLTGVKGKLASCPDKLPADWKCDATVTDNYLIGPGADLFGADLTGATLRRVKGKLASCPFSDKLPLLDRTDGGQPFEWMCDATLTNNYLIGPFADLSGADLTGTNLAGADLVGNDLEGADLSGADLAGATLSYVYGTLENCPDKIPAGWVCDADGTRDILIGPGADLSDVDLTDMVLTGVDLTNQTPVNGKPKDLRNADLTEADLSGADLSDTLLSLVHGELASCPAITALPTGWVCDSSKTLIDPAASLGNADLTDADLTAADLSSADLTGATLTGVKGKLASCPNKLPAGGWVCGETLTKNYLVGPDADLTGADLTGATLTGVKGKLVSCPDKLPAGGWVCENKRLIGPGADLRSVDLSDADLSGADLSDNTLLALVRGELASCPAITALPAGWVCDSSKTLIDPAASLGNADLTGTDLTDADLSGADLTGATLTGVKGKLSSCPDKLPAVWVCENNYLIGPGADLTGADLSGADLTGADLTGADLTGVTIDPATRIGTTGDSSACSDEGALAAVQAKPSLLLQAVEAQQGC